MRLIVKVNLIFLLFSVISSHHGLADFFQAGAKNNFASFYYNKKNCIPTQSGEITFHKGLFYPDGDLNERALSTLRPIEEVQKASAVTYNADERIGQRIYLTKEGQFQGVLGPGIYENARGENAFPKLSPQLIAGIIKQMEEALNKGYAQWVNYLDMGHVHPSLPRGVLSTRERKNSDDESFQTQVFAHPQILLLYHVAEKIDFYQGFKQVIAKHKKRFLSRNLLGKPYQNQDLDVRVAEESRANTFRLPLDHEYQDQGATLYFHGNKNGCFQLQTKNGPINFDMSFNIPPGDPEVLAQFPDE